VEAASKGRKMSSADHYDPDADADYARRHGLTEDDDARAILAGMAKGGKDD